MHALRTAALAAASPLLLLGPDGPRAKGSEEAPIPVVGDLAPRVRTDERILPGADGAGRGPGILLPAEGRLTVIEFTASWCAPCLGTLPHVDRVHEELAPEIADGELLFALVSNETRPALERFASEYRPSVPLHRDADSSILRDYGIGPIPHVVIVDAEGEIVARTSPGELTAARLRALLAGDRSVTFRPAPVREGDGSPASFAASQPLLAGGEAGASLRRVETKGRSALYDDRQGTIEIAGWPVQEITFFALEVLPRYVHFEGSFPRDEYYRVQVRAPDASSETAFAMLRSLVESAFELEIRADPREEDVLVLVRVPGADPPARSERSKREAALAEEGFALEPGRRPWNHYVVRRR